MEPKNDDFSKRNLQVFWGTIFKELTYGTVVI